jgi:hypothetical protein
MSLLGGADQQGEAAGGGHQGRGGREDGFEAFDGAESDQVEGGRSQGFGAGVLYIDVGQCKGTGDFAQEGSFFVIGLDQGEGDLGSPDFYGQAGEAGAGAEVGEGKPAVGRWPLVVG